MIKECETYWGTHGCYLPKNHTGYCECNCCTCEGEKCDEECVAKYPYYGPQTHFYGKDADIVLWRQTKAPCVFLDSADMESIENETTDM